MVTRQFSPTSLLLPLDDEAALALARVVPLTQARPQRAQRACASHPARRLATPDETAPRVVVGSPLQRAECQVVKATGQHREALRLRQLAGW